MDLNKVGLFIAKLRKKKGLTQVEFGEIIGVNDKTVSRWENGKNAPDISMLKLISETLEVSVSELLNGERNASIDINVLAMKYYNNRLKNRVIVISIILILILFLIFSICFSINKYRQYKLFSILPISENLKLEGFVVLNPHKSIIVIRNIEYIDYNEGTIDEIKSKSFNIKLISNRKVLSEQNYNYQNEISLRDFLESYTIYIDEDIKKNEDVIVLSNLVFEIEYEESDEIKKITFSLDLIEEKW